MYIAEMQKILQIVNELDFFVKIERIGIRYIDFLKDINIFEKIKYKVNNPLSYNNNQTQIKNVFLKDDFFIIINIINNIYNNKEIGSIFDIDVFTNNNMSIEFDKILKIINDLHLTQKEIFFEYLEEDYLKTLNPQY